MGLTIHYTLKSHADSPEAARSMLEQLHRRARRLPFQQVLPLEAHPGASADDRGEDSLWLCSSTSIERGRTTYDVPPRHGFAFFIVPGPGCEWASIGLLNYPQTIRLPDGRRIRTGQSGWSWHSFCKTQYASDPRHGGFENFRRCHVSLVELLDAAIELGIQTKLHDESQYATHRDFARLRQEVDKWNELVAGAVGQLNDSLPGKGEAPITAFPNFEHLEARGRSTLK